MKDIEKTIPQPEAQPQQDQTQPTRQPSADHRAEQLYALWLEQAEQAKEVYPAFDLKTQLEDSRFCRLIQMGLTMEEAYGLCHLEDIKAEAVRQTEKRLLGQIHGSRPVENGADRGAAVTLRRDVRALDKQARAELVKRAARGEEIRF